MQSIVVMNSEAPQLKGHFGRIFPSNQMEAALDELFFLAPEHSLLLYWLHFIQQFTTWSFGYKWFVSWSLVLLFSLPSGT